MEQFWAGISFIGEPELWVALPLALFVVYLVIRKAWPHSRAREPLKTFLFILIPSITIVLGGIYLTKLALPLERPCTVCTGVYEPGLCNPYCESDPSFPSGHAGASFTAFTALYIALKGKAKLLIMFILPTLVCASRVALGVHTLSDVLAGASLAVLVTCIVWAREKQRGWLIY